MLPHLITRDSPDFPNLQLEARFAQRTRKRGIYLGGRFAGSKFEYLVAALVYLALSLIWFGRYIVGHLSDSYMGGGTDPICHIWAIAWWPYAISHWINPLITHALWAPEGYNLVWATSITGPSLVVYPITRVLGPVVSYSLLSLGAPSAAAFSAFLVCR